MEMLNSQFGLEFGAWDKELSCCRLEAIVTCMAVLAIEYMKASRKCVRNGKVSGLRANLEEP